MDIANSPVSYTASFQTPLPVETLFETKPKRSSSLLQRVGTGETAYDQLSLRGFDGVYNSKDGSLEEILSELAIIVLAHAEVAGIVPAVFVQLDDLLDDADEFEQWLGHFGDDEDEIVSLDADDFDPFGGCECDECSLERAALNADIR